MNIERFATFSNNINGFFFSQLNLCLASTLNNFLSTTTPSYLKASTLSTSSSFITVKSDTLVC